MCDELSKRFPPEDVKKRVIAAVLALYRHDRELLDIGANERSITHKLAEHLQREFPYWHVDCEYNRRGHDTKRLNTNSQCRHNDLEAKTVIPDIIVHRRGTKQNLIVIEVKKAGGQEETEDIEKLERFTRPEGCYRYRYGLFLSLDSNGADKLELYQAGKCAEAWTDELCNALKVFGYGG